MIEGGSKMSPNNILAAKVAQCTKIIFDWVSVIKASFLNN